MYSDLPDRRGSGGLIVFDLDGTVIDSKPVMVQALRTAYARAGGVGEPPVDGFLRLLGAPLPDILAALGLPAAMNEAFRAVARASLNQIVVHADVVAACAAMRAAGCRTAICTGKDRERTQEILDWFNLSSLFDAVAAGDDPQPGKPAPDGILGLCRALDVEPGRTVVVGDSALDIQAGRAAGARTIGCLWGIGTGADLRGAGASGIVGTAADLCGTLLAWSDDLSLATPRSR